MLEGQQGRLLWRRLRMMGIEGDVRGNGVSSQCAGKPAYELKL